MKKRAKHGRGTVRTVRNREGEIIGYQAYLPRSQSEAPEESARAADYKEPVGPRMPTKPAARELLDAAILELRQRQTLKHGLPLSHYVQQAIKVELNEAKRKYGSAARANDHVATWRSIDRRWLSKSELADWPPQHIETPDLQRWFDWLRDEAEGKGGDPLSGSYIRQIASLVRGALDRANLPTNPALSLKLPGKDAPSIRFLDLASQRRLFGAGEEQIPLTDRVMIGCGMGAGLRVGELLSIEVEDVHVHHADPHIVVRYGGPDQAPTKGGRERVVELFEPGLGFWLAWMLDHYRAGRLVFGGPKGGYQKAWPEQFPGWAKTAGVKRLSSHLMRHSYAVAMLSGLWGYEPKTLDFVSQQLGHADRQTTERYYGAYAPGVWRTEVRHMTGRSPAPRRVVTAAELLGTGAAAHRLGSKVSKEVPIWVDDGTGTVSAESSANLDLTHQSAHRGDEADLRAAIAEHRARAEAAGTVPRAHPVIARRAGTVVRRKKGGRHAG